MKVIFLLLTVLMFYNTEVVLGQPVELDVTFGDNGVVLTDLGGDEDDCSIVLQPDGKIVLAGNSILFEGSEWRYVIFVLRYNVDGTPDSTFGDAGVVVTGFEDNSQYYAESIAVQSDGKILVAGSIKEEWPESDIMVLRYNEDGTLDTSFDGDGLARVMTEGIDYGHSLAIQSDGKIVVGGTAYASAPFDISFRVVRFHAEGSLDNTFGFNGIVTVDFDPEGSGDHVTSVAIQSDGKIVVAGSSLSSGYGDFAVIRCTTEGALDYTFNADGKVTTSIGERSQGHSVAIQSDEKIVLAGVTGLTAGNDPSFAAVRYTTDGTPDPTFGNYGVVVTSFEDNSFDWAESVIIQSDGKILVAGLSGSNLPDTDGNFGLVRYNTDGTLDNSFGTGGKVSIDFGYSESGKSMVIQPDGNIVIAGIITDFSENLPTGYDHDFVVARYLNDLDVGVIDWSIQNNSFIVFPNPIRGSAILQYELTRTEVLTIELFDITGRLIQPIFTNEKRNPGKHQEELYLDDSIPSGNYLLTISSGNQRFSMKISKF